MTNVHNHKKHLSDPARSIAIGAGRESLIRETAHSLYQARSCVTGFELQDWLQAEALVNQMPGKAANSSE